MKALVCTLMWGTAYEKYGRKFLDTFDRYWPRNVDLVVITDRDLKLPRGRQILLKDVCGYTEFMRDWADDPRAQGKQSKDRKATPGKRYWKHDAVKWAPQGLAPRAGITHLKDNDIFCWLDADVETTAEVRGGWLEELLGGHDVACLQRGTQHSEIGFWAMRMKPETRNVIREFAYLYATGAVFDLPEWHSAYVWDRALRTEKGLKVRNLNPLGRHGHPWPATALAEFTRHNKGKLKGA